MSKQRIGQKVRESLDRINSGLATSKDGEFLQELIVNTFKACLEYNPTSDQMIRLIDDIQHQPEAKSQNNVIQFPSRGIEQ